jgi:hypothetical protein
MTDYGWTQIFLSVNHFSPIEVRRTKFYKMPHTDLIIHEHASRCLSIYVKNMNHEIYGLVMTLNSPFSTLTALFTSCTVEETGTVTGVVIVVVSFFE